MEFYTHKGQKLLYEGMEIVSTARLPYGGMKQVTENTGKFEACFNLLLPQGNCCNAPPPENKPSSVIIDLDNVEQSYASAVKQSSKTCPPTKISSTTTNTTNQSPQTHPTKQTKGNLSSTDTAAKKSSSACSSIDSAKQPSQATYFKQRSPTSTKANHKQPTPANVTTAKQTSATFEATQPSQPMKNFVKQSFPAPTNGKTPKTNSAVESSQDPAPKDLQLLKLQELNLAQPPLLQNNPMPLLTLTTWI